ncbi:MAG: hypothetical protein ACOC3I_04045 [Verrucomicrobiota bacterium]
MPLLRRGPYREAVRLAVLLGGDADTERASPGHTPKRFCGGVPEDLREVALARLPRPLGQVSTRFTERWRR